MHVILSFRENCPRENQSYLMKRRFDSLKAVNKQDYNKESQKDPQSGSGYNANEPILLRGSDNMWRLNL